MNYPSIRIEGAILSPDILDQVEELPGQRPSDFALDPGARIKDEIARAWADAQDYWRIFQRKLEAVKEGNNATSETRNLWMVPLLGLLRYDVEYQPRGAELNGRRYAISHRAANRADTPVQIIGARDPAGLDRKPANASRRMSAHALVQEFLNLHDQLYGLVTDGRTLRLLRDSSRLVKQSYLEFDLDRIFTDGLFADFAVLYRLLHATRLPLTNDAAPQSLIERYHQDSLDSGARIREGLSKAVEQAILDFGNGFLSHPDNEALREAVAAGDLRASDYYQQLLRLIYRLLFLMVIEERDLVFPPDAPKSQRDIHHNFYSVSRLRRLSEKRYLADRRRHDLWLALQACFRLFEADGPGARLGIAPLAGDLFSPEAIGALAGCALGNDVLLECLRALGLYRHPDSGQIIRVNYAALNVEEFGSVYEGLLEYQPEFTGEERELRFQFRHGGQRAATGSHYTPDDLVQPLIRHSLDHLIDERIKAEDPEAALLGLRVADIACGSGHILLAAARRIATELAVVRTGEEQPSPPAYRSALRDAIRNCIYGVDLNPLAVELCKVALWLEAHIPGQPLNFLDHHIKCGNAIVGFARREELGQGVPTEAFKTLPGDDKGVAANYRRRNKADLRNQTQGSFEFAPELQAHLDAILKEWQSLSALPEKTPAQIDAKKERFVAFAKGPDAGRLRAIADIPVAQFYIPKVPGNEANLVTDAEFRGYWRGSRVPQGQGADAARTVGKNRGFFHWFLEFPEAMEAGGFDCILGNPPYLGGKRISGTLGDGFLQWCKWKYRPAGGLSDLAVYFLRRVANLLRTAGFFSLITTNTISQGDSRSGGLSELTKAGYDITFSNKSIRWPGLAALEVTLLGVYKGQWRGRRVLDGKVVTFISSLLDDSEDAYDPIQLQENAKGSFIGSVLLGTGFLLEDADMRSLLESDMKNANVLRPYLSGADLNSSPQQLPQRWAIDFGGLSEVEAMEYPDAFHLVKERVRPQRLKVKRKTYRDNWWLYAEQCENLYRAISGKKRVMAVAQTSKTLAFAFVPAGYVYPMMIVVFNTDKDSDFAVFQSNIHYHWAWKYASTLKSDLRYVPTDIERTFPRPRPESESLHMALESVGKQYYEHRKQLMHSLWIGLTKIYNLFHARDLSCETVAKVSKKDPDTAAVGFNELLKLRRLHVEIDHVVRDAYGWQDLELEHDFHEVETLPENDRIRYTISPTARREVLKRLLAENHARAEFEAQQPLSKAARGGRAYKISDPVML